MPRIDITDEELVLLDRKCSEEIQKEVNAAMARIASAKANPDLPETLAKFIASVVEEANKNGKLIYRYTQIRTCKGCGQSGGYYKYARNSRYHRKGENNYDQPRYLSGVEFADRFVIVTGHPTVGCCSDCLEKVKPTLLEALKDIPCELPEKLTGEPPCFRKYDHKECEKCGWKGNEGQMIRLRAMMEGTYPGECPKCHAQNLGFGPTYIKTVKGFDVVPVEAPLVHQ